ncbi:YidB family protein [Streptomyces erythrochromogenes]|uniref:YidB family protein n=1 Tax=Streptomyces erythrochromogenes TaxID=285574 RepID=UPI00368D19BF
MTDENSTNVEPTSLTISAQSLAEAGLEPQVRSWIGDGPNKTITAGQIVTAVGEDQLARAAENLGREPADLAADLAARLPELIDTTAPDGRTTPDAAGRVPGFQLRWAPVPAQDLTTDPALQPQTAPADSLNLNNDVAIDGSVTLTVRYL